MPNIRIFIKLARPLLILLAALTYFLGVGITRYLGHSLNFASMGLGLLAILAIQVAAFWLVEFFHLPFTPLAKGETPRNREAFRIALLQSSMALLTVSGATVVTLLIARLIPISAGVFLLLIILLFYGYSVPPLRLSDIGYGELILAISLGTLYPALAFFIQYGEYHRLLTFATFPLTLLALAYLLVNDFPTFATDIKYGRNSMLTRLTWQRAIPIHHLLVLLSFLFFALVPLLGFPWGLVWPVFLVLPFAAIQVIWIQRIARGGRALWKFIVPLAATVFGLTAYLLALTLWIR
jgi:1,4-dihydroxy-2-naphthoate octaprenyltransferase